MISALSELLSEVVLVTTSCAFDEGGLQITMLSGTFPCSVQNERSSDMVAVNGVPGVSPRIWYDGSFGPLGVLPTLPENPVWLLHAAIEMARIAPSALIDKVRAMYRIISFLTPLIEAASRTHCCKRRGRCRRDASSWSDT